MADSNSRNFKSPSNAVSGGFRSHRRATEMMTPSHKLFDIGRNEGKIMGSTL